MVFIMITKNQVIFNTELEKFKYLQREENIKTKKVDMINLNARLNRNKKLNFYTNVKIIAFSISCLSIVTLITLKF